ncbi:MAG: hypothetical protein ACE14S_05275 [Candidatus Bathyarchaeia archaeon]
MYFDVLMPTVLFAVTVAAMFLAGKAERRLKATVEEREFRNRDVAMLGVMVAAAVSVVVFVPNLIITAVFLFSYCSLLFTVSFAFSGMRRRRLTVFCGTLVVASVLAGAAGFLGVLSGDLRVFGTLAFAGLAFCSFITLLYARGDAEGKSKWYVAALSPVLFLLLFFFFNGTGLWFPFLLDVFGIVFALLIVVYLGTLFTWKTVFIFAAFITSLDIVLVWLTGTMVQAANAVSGLGLPVLVAFPTFPFITSANGILIMRLGLGDFFFAGILGVQTLKKFGWKTAVVSVLTTCISFALFELVLLNESLSALLPVRALPATLPILVGWLPVVAARMLSARKRDKPTP